ncbi:MAG TPA: hydrogenase maturation protease, partial [Candidatus Korarchaeota archaeon]|nr:hydrogenase maturation protease [Candidatus Korarchaeota archaeon]
MRDDGLGSCFAEALSTLPLPNWVRAVDGGIGGLSLIDPMEGAEVLVLVDALSRDHGQPGEAKILVVNPSAVRPEEAVRMLLEAGSHGVTPEILLAAASALGVLPPRSYVAGVVPAEVDVGMGLSDAALEGCLRLMGLINDLLRSEGYGILNVRDEDLTKALKAVCPRDPPNI